MGIMSVLALVCFSLLFIIVVVDDRNYQQMLEKHGLIECVDDGYGGHGTPRCPEIPINFILQVWYGLAFFGMLMIVIRQIRNELKTKRDEHYKTRRRRSYFFVTAALVIWMVSLMQYSTYPELSVAGLISGLILACIGFYLNFTRGRDYGEKYTDGRGSPSAVKAKPPGALPKDFKPKSTKKISDDYDYTVGYEYLARESKEIEEIKGKIKDGIKIKKNQESKEVKPKEEDKKEETSMFCDNCGTAFKKPTAKFCSGCGTPRS